MGKSAIAVAGTAFLMLPAWNAQATPLTGAATITAPAPNHSAIEEVGCKGKGLFCPWGRHWICPPYRTCWCAPCGAYKRPGGKYRD